MKWRHWSLGICSLVLTSCQSLGPAVGLRPPSTSFAVPTSVAASATPSLSTSLPVATLAATAPSPLSAGWHYTHWEGLLIPLPPQALLIPRDPLPSPDETNGLPVIAATTVTLPPPPTPVGGAIGEYPAPPQLTLLRFSGTITEWLQLERANPLSQAGNTVVAVTPLTVADRAAIHYQRSVPGFGPDDYYALKPTKDTLLWIFTDATAYGPMIEHLAIQTP